MSREPMAEGFGTFLLADEISQYTGPAAQLGRSHSIRQQSTRLLNNALAYCLSSVYSCIDVQFHWEGYIIGNSTASYTKIIS